MLHDPTMFPQLLQYLTMPVSEMFRDPAYFLALRQEVVPLLQTYPSLKIWVAGCSTGEEVYSLAILLRKKDCWTRAMIYATDINPQSLEKARTGVFALENRQDLHRQLSEGRWQAFLFRLLHRGLRRSPVRPLADARTSSSPTTAWRPTACSPKRSWSRCRNVLIYFNKTLQDRALRPVP